MTQGGIVENSIRKMIEEYNNKISCQDILLKSVNEKIQEMREKRDCQFDKWAIMDLDDLRQERHLINARRQAYVQAKADFKDLIGEL